MLKLFFNGVQTNISLRFRSLIFYSSATTQSAQASHFMVDYLSDTLGFSQREALAASKKVSHIESPENPNSVIHFFKQLGLSQSQIKTIVYRNAVLLSTSDVHKTLTPKIRVFQDLGLSGSDLGNILAANPSILSRKLETHIKPLIKSLRSILGSDENVVKAIKRSYLLLSSNVPKKILSNANTLRNYGLSEERITKLVLTNPWSLICPPELLKETLKYVEEKLGIHREQHMFIHAVDTFCSMKKDTVELKLQVFRSYGWTDKDIMTMSKQLPLCLRLSEEKIRSGLDFFMKELEYSAEYMASHPKLLMYSLEKRVFPRRVFWKVLKEKKLIKNSKKNLYSILCITDQRFLDDYVMCYRNELPRLCEAYVNKSLSHSSVEAVM